METESSQNTLKKSYALALLTLVGSQPGARDDPLFGFAIRQVKSATIYHQTAHELLHALIEHSPSPETVAGQFLEELATCGNTEVVTLVNNLNGDGTVSPDEWAADVHRKLNENGGNMVAVTELAHFCLAHLVNAFRNCGGATPQESLPLTPDPGRTEETKFLLDEATIRHDQAALKELAIRRDGPSCLITGFPFEGDERVTPRCSHIVPFAFNDKTPVLAAIEMFTGKAVSANMVLEFINNPANVINIEFNAHEAMHKRLAWGIEARPVNNKWKYRFRIVKSALPRIVKDFIKDGDEITFGMGEYGAEIPLPDPQLCNLHPAVARVFVASGFAEVIEKYLRDDDRDAAAGTGGFGDELTRRLQTYLVLG